jgi:protein phosphatase
MPHPATPMIAAGQTDIGRVRTRNEDHWEIEAGLGLALVCDGMGGHAGGDIASRTAAAVICETIREHCRDGVPSDTDAAVSILRTAIRLANRRLHALNRERGFAEGRGMGTTLVGLWCPTGDDQLIAFHAGDSRLYRLRHGALAQLTRDHSLYQMWLDGGGLGAAPHKNIITSALGSSEQVDPEIVIHDVAVGDLYLLCSDGLNGLIADDVIAGLLPEAGQRLEDGCAALVAAANEAGGHDNVTVLLARFERPQVQDLRDDGGRIRVVP